MARTADESAPERAYQALKQGLRGGRLGFRQRLDPNAIAQDLGVSTTPVREALIRLRAERLVAFRPTHGFFVALWSEAGLRALYLWRGALAAWAYAQTQEPVIDAYPMPDDYAARTEALLTALGPSANPELIGAASNADDRLARARSAEVQIWPHAGAELDRIAALLASGGKSKALRALKRYHDKRTEAAGEIREQAVLSDLPDNGG